MNKFAVTFFTLALLTLSATSQASNPYPAQTRCNLTEASAPAVRGLKLGMSTQQVLTMFPGITKNREMKDSIDRAKSATGGEAVYLGFNPVTDGEAPQFAAIESVGLAVYKGHVVDISVQYGGATWRTIDEWIAKLSESFNLPNARDWVVGPNEAPNKVLRCEGVQIEAAIQGGSASIRIMNPTYLRDSEDRAKAAEDKKRQDVKP
jgi:hypothetical protein